jgi:hypothetical protein
MIYTLDAECSQVPFVRLSYIVPAFYFHSGGTANRAPSPSFRLPPGFYHAMSQDRRGGKNIAGLGRSIASQSMHYGRCPPSIGFMEAAVLAPPLLFVYYQDGVFTKTAVMCNDVCTSKMSRLTERHSTDCQRSRVALHPGQGMPSGSAGVPD